MQRVKNAKKAQQQATELSKSGSIQLQGKETDEAEFDRCSKKIRQAESAFNKASEKVLAARKQLEDLEGKAKQAADAAYDEGLLFFTLRIK